MLPTSLIGFIVIGGRELPERLLNFKYSKPSFTGYNKITIKVITTETMREALVALVNKNLPNINVNNIYKNGAKKNSNNKGAIIIATPILSPGFN
jgi:hypothetical protein